MKKKWIVLISIIAIVAIVLAIVLIPNSRFLFSDCSIHGGKCYGFGDFVSETCEDHGMTTLQYQCPTITLNTQCCK